MTDAVRKAGLDKFYTIPEISKKCIETVASFYDWNSWDFVIEPSAGNGSFLSKIPTTKRIGIDISPGSSDIIKQNYLTYRPPTSYKNILVIGNPPFGKISSLAIQFFNHSAYFASTIAFILPRTFRRISVQNKLNEFFHLIHDEDIPSEPCPFDPPISAKCCFQIWIRKENKRDIVILHTSHPDWEFLALGPLDKNDQPTPPPNADFAIRAYGGNCGEIKDVQLHLLRPKSWHWIKAKAQSATTLIERFESLDYSISMDTARQNSIGRGDLVTLYSESFPTV